MPVAQANVSKATIYRRNGVVARTAWNEFRLQMASTHSGLLAPSDRNILLAAFVYSVSPLTGL